MNPNPAGPVEIPAQYEEYETLLLERDQLQKEAKSIWISYRQLFGALISDTFERKIACIRIKKTMSYIQMAANRGRAVEPGALQEWLAREMAVYQAQLSQLIDENDHCRKAQTSSPYEVQRSKTLYRRLAKRIHPDIFPETERQEALKELWQRILAAYGQNNVKALTELEVLVQKVLEDLGVDAVQIDIPDIEEKIEMLKDEILDILHTEPYTYKELLEDDDAVRLRKAELEEERDSYIRYEKELNDILHRMLIEEGVTLQWNMKTDPTN